MYSSLKQFFSANGRLENNVVHKDIISRPVNFKQVKHTKIDPTSPVGFEDLPLEWQEELAEGRLPSEDYEKMLASYKKHIVKRKLSRRAEKIKNLKEIEYIERNKGNRLIDEREIKKLSTVDDALETLLTTSTYYSRRKIEENIEYPTIEALKYKTDDEEEEEEEKEEEDDDEFY